MCQDILAHLSYYHKLLHFSTINFMNLRQKSAGLPTNLCYLTNAGPGAIIMWTIEKLLRGKGFVRESLLNKITGCESRTVPPLYVPMVDPTTKVSHWETGKTGSLRKQARVRRPTLQPFSASCALWEVRLVAEKRLRHLLWVPQSICF
jgi:hypothetical protein